MSNIVGPFALREMLRRYEAKALRDITAALADGGSFYLLDLRCRSRWGLMGDLLNVLANAKVSVIDFRTNSSDGFNSYEAYLKDNVVGTHEHDRKRVLRELVLPLLAHDPDATGHVGEHASTLHGLVIQTWHPHDEDAEQSPPPPPRELRSDTRGAAVEMVASEMTSESFSPSSVASMPSSLPEGPSALERAAAADSGLAGAIEAAAEERQRNELEASGLHGFLSGGALSARFSTSDSFGDEERSARFSQRLSTQRLSLDEELGRRSGRIGVVRISEGPSVLVSEAQETG